MLTFNYFLFAIHFYHIILIFSKQFNYLRYLKTSSDRQEMVKKIYSEISTVQEKIDELVDKLIQKESDLKEVERLEALQLQRAESLETAALRDGEDSKSIDSMEYNRAEEVETNKKGSRSVSLAKSKKFPQAKIVVDSMIIPGMLNDKNICQRLDIINASRDRYPPSCDGSLESTDRRIRMLDIKQSSSMDDMVGLTRCLRAWGE